MKYLRIAAYTAITISFLRKIRGKLLPEPMLDILRRDHILVLRGNLEGLPYPKDTIRKLRDIPGGTPELKDLP